MTDIWTSWPAPAKLNLFLHIVGRRADGYHLLQTVFQLLDWGDTVHMRVREDGAIRRLSAIPDVAEESDLCIRAAYLLQQYSGCALGAEIALDKRIPLGGGLGGGSSDAASVLLGLNALWNLDLPIDTLATLGLRLGADVPVFIQGQTSWAEGIGEQLTPLPLPRSVFVILDPRVKVPTAELFQSPELTRNAPQMTIPVFLSGATTANAFEPIVRKRYPAVEAALNWLAQFGTARLSGSGGCVFVEVATRKKAEMMVQQCPAEFAATIAQGVEESLLLDAIRQFRTQQG